MPPVPGTTRPSATTPVSRPGRSRSTTPWTFYCAGLERAGRNAARDVRGKYCAWAKGRFGHREASKITTRQFEDFFDEIAESPPKRRTKAGSKKPRFRAADKSEEGARKRRATAKRLWTMLKAALNSAWRAGKIPSDAAWKRVKVFEGVDGVRVDYLRIAETTRLVNACEPDFRRLVQGGLLTGGRYGSLISLVIGDFNADAGTVAFKSRKGRGVVKVYYCHLTAEGIAFFEGVCAGRNDQNAPIFLRADGDRWGTSEQLRRMKDARRRRLGEKSASIICVTHMGKPRSDERHAAHGSRAESRPRRHPDGREALRSSRAVLQTARDPEGRAGFRNQTGRCRAAMNDIKSNELIFLGDAVAVIQKYPV
jgi:integrase